MITFHHVVAINLKIEWMFDKRQWELVFIVFLPSCHTPNQWIRIYNIRDNTLFLTTLGKWNVLFTHVIVIHAICLSIVAKFWTQLEWYVGGLLGKKVSLSQAKSKNEVWNLALAWYESKRIRMTCLGCIMYRRLAVCDYFYFIFLVNTACMEIQTSTSHDTDI